MIFSLIFFLVLFFFTSSPTLFTGYVKDIENILKSSYNYYLWKNIGYFNAVTDVYPLIHYWSLSVEVQFYLILPLISFLTEKLNKNLLYLSFFILFVISVYLGSIEPHFSYYMLPTRLWLFVLGVIISDKIKLLRSNDINKNLGFASLIIFFLLITFIDIGSLIPSPYHLILILFVSLMIISNFDLSFNFKYIKKIIDFYANISFSFYLYHQQILNIVKNNIESNVFFISFFITTLISFISYELIEKNFKY